MQDAVPSSPRRPAGRKNGTAAKDVRSRVLGLAVEDARGGQRPDRELAELLRPHLPVLVGEIVAKIHRDVPEFARPARGRRADDIRPVVEWGLCRFLARLIQPDAPWDPEVRVYQALGRAEYFQGRSPDALQAAYRIAARLAWHRFSQVADRHEIPPRRIFSLAESIFTHVEEISGCSVGAHAELAAQASGAPHRRRRRLLELLVADPPATHARDITRLAQDVQWRLPRRVACLVLGARWQTGDLLSPALGPDVLMDLENPAPYLLFPDPDAPAASTPCVVSCGTWTSYSAPACRWPRRRSPCGWPARRAA